MEILKTCSKCGYTRKPLDNEFSNALPNACPRCFAFYETAEPSQPEPSPVDPET